MNRRVKKSLERVFSYRERIKKWTVKLDKERTFLADHMSAVGSRRLSLDKDRHINLIEPTTIEWDISSLKKILKQKSIRKKAKKAGFIKGNESLSSVVLVVTESVSRETVEDLLSNGVLTKKQVNSFMKIKSIKTYVK